MILPATGDRGLVVFHVWPALAYATRMGLSFGLMAAGLAAQLATGRVLPGVVLIALGNLLLLVRGYDNRVDAKGFDPAAEWEPVTPERLQELGELHRRMRRWDRSALDVTNGLGLLLFLLVTAGLALAIWRGDAPVRILAIDAAVLLLPHWLTGTRSILVKPKLMVRVELIERLLQEFAPRLRDHRVHLLMLLQGHGRATKIPDDVKFKIDLEHSRERFLGLYGQVTLNEVSGRSYPYFYVVCVARRGYGLIQAAGTYQAPRKITVESNVTGEVEVLVMRQTTTKTAGYHTKYRDAARIFDEGLRLGETLAAGAGSA